MQTANVILLHKPEIPNPSIHCDLTTVGIWRDFVQHGEVQAGLPLNQEMESFLVFTLMRFTHRTDLASVILAIKFLEAFSKMSGRYREVMLGEVGGTALIFGGLFSDRLRGIHRGTSYYESIGSAAFDELSFLFERRRLHGKAGLYRQARDMFPFLIDVLLATRDDREWFEMYSPLSLD